MASQFEWNFIFLIYADLTTNSNDPDSDSSKFELLREMLNRLPVSEKCNLFTIKNVIVLNNNKDRRVVWDQFTCERYFAGSSSPVFGKVIAGTMDEKPGIIGNYLKQIRDAFPSDKTALFTWDHGSVFGINKVVPHQRKAFGIFSLEPEEVSSPNELLDFYINPILLRERHGVTKNDVLTDALKKVRDPSKWLKDFMGEAFHPERLHEEVEPVVDMLTNEMLSSALEQGGYKLDIVCMMNCCMQNMHLAYAIHQQVSILLAPVTWIYFPGYDYLSIFKALHDQPVMNATALANCIIDVCKKDEISSTPVVSKAPNEGIFAIRLDHICAIAGHFQQIVQFEISYITGFPKRIDYLASIFGNSFKEFEETDIINYRLIDLSELYAYLIRRPQTFPAPYPQLCLDAYDLFKQSKISEFIGRNIQTIDNHKITGLTMSLPNQKTYCDPSQLFIQLYFKPGRYQSRLISETHLDKLVEILFK